MQMRDSHDWHERCNHHAGRTRICSCPVRHQNAEQDASRSIHLPTVREAHMLYYAIVFLIIALIAALFGFGGIAAGAAGFAKILFVIFLLVEVVTFLLSLGKR